MPSMDAFPVSMMSCTVHTMAAVGGDLCGEAREGGVGARGGGGTALSRTSRPKACRCRGR